MDSSGGLIELVAFEAGGHALHVSPAYLHETCVWGCFSAQINLFITRIG